MLSRYGFRFEDKAENDNISGPNPSSTSQNLLLDALYFATDGLVQVPSGTMWQNGNSGRIWGTTAGDSVLVANDLRLHKTIIFAAYQNDRSFGFSLRKYKQRKVLCLRLKNY